MCTVFSPQKHFEKYLSYEEAHLSVLDACSFFSPLLNLPIISEMSFVCFLAPQIYHSKRKNQRKDSAKEEKLESGTGKRMPNKLALAKKKRSKI